MAIYTNSHGRSGPEIDEMLEKGGTSVQPADDILTRFTVDPRVPVGSTLIVLSNHTIGAYDAGDDETHSIDHETGVWTTVSGCGEISTT